LVDRSETRVAEAVALVDFDNVVDQQVYTGLDAESALSRITEICFGCVREHFAESRSLQIRLYTARDDPTGAVTRLARLLRTTCGPAAHTREGVHITYLPVESLAFEANVHRPLGLAAFLQEERCRCYAGTQVRVQKLTDSMIVADTIFFSSFPSHGVVVVSDDMDMLPGVLMGADQRSLVVGRSNDIVWLRPTCYSTDDEAAYHRFFVLRGGRS
jgi:hypothetical protein